MLTKFAVTGFRNFEKRIELDLTNSQHFDFNLFAIKDGIIKNGIIYGPNGCGKSNFSMAIFDIVYHLTQKFKNPNYIQNYTFAGSRSIFVKFEYTFNFDGQNVEYTYSKDFRGILQEEKLFVNKKQIFSKRLDTFEIDENLFPMKENIKDSLIKSANNISVINFLFSTYPLEETNYIIKLQKFADSMLWFRCLEGKEFTGLETNIYIIDEYIIRNDFVEEFSDFLKEVSGQNFRFVTPKNGDRFLYVYINDIPQKFNTIASTGTHALTLLFFWIKHLNTASFVFIDEFDAFYHFKLSYNVCKALFNNDCQVFLTSHNTYLMTNDLLRPDCNFILDNGKITALCDATDKELCEGHNIEKLYRGGTFII